MKKIDVVQLGARMHYAVPAIFAQNEALGTFFTDIWKSKSTFFYFLSTLPVPVLKRLRSRTHPDIPSEIVQHFPKFAFNYAAALRSVGQNREKETQVFLQFGERFQKLVLESGLLQSDQIYAFNSVAKDLFLAEENQHKTKILEQTLVPRLIEHQLLEMEFDAFGISLQRGAASREYEQLEIEECKLADTILVGSDFVKRALTQLGINESKIQIIPYGYTSKTVKNAHPKVQGRMLKVLFVGNGGIRKGLKYALEAIKNMPMIKLTVAGKMESILVDSYKSYSNIEFLGSVDRVKVANLYAQNDLLLLPSICEGSATVSYEALAYGLPVLCTPNAGTIITSKKDGIIFPIRSVIAIQEVLEKFLKRPILLSELSIEAIKTAKLHTEEAYGIRLMKALF